MSSYSNPNHNGTGLPGDQPQSGLDQTRQQVDEVVDIMRNNVEKGNYIGLDIFEISINSRPVKIIFVSDFVVTTNAQMRKLFLQYAFVCRLHYSHSVPFRLERTELQELN